MNARRPGPPRVLMVCTRDIPEHAESGRERTMAFILRSLLEGGDVQFLRLRSLLEQKSVGRALATTLAALNGLLLGRPLPLQALLFHDRAQMRALDSTVLQYCPDAVYFDGVRSGILAFALRKRHPGLRIVCDFDDLMSRRIEMLALSRQPISMGYLKKLVPEWVQRYLLDGFVAQGVQWYEARALRSVENRLCKTCDEVVLVSSVDAVHLQQQAKKAVVAVIPPFMALPAGAMALPEVKRFVFVGSDSLLQNRQAIEFLVSLWARVVPSTPLHIFGKQERTYPALANVAFRGFVPEIAAAYEAGSVLLAPSFLAGGVKTKVLEAMSFGVIPLGTAITFEGIGANCDALAASVEQIEQWVLDPQRWVHGWFQEGRRVIEEAAQSHATARLGDRWRTVVWPHSNGEERLGVTPPSSSSGHRLP